MFVLDLNLGGDDLSFGFVDPETLCEEALDFVALYRREPSDNDDDGGVGPGLSYGNHRLVTAAMMFAIIAVLYLAGVSKYASRSASTALL